MSVLLRHPACVPALFSRAAEPEAFPDRPSSRWRRLLPAAPLVLAAIVVLADVPLVEAAAAAVSLVLQR